MQQHFLCLDGMNSAGSVIDAPSDAIMCQILKSITHKQINKQTQLQHEH